MPQSTRKAAAPARSPYRFFYGLLSLVALAGIAFLVYSVVRARVGGSAALQPLQITDTTNLRQVYARAVPITEGQASAPVKMVIFSDFTCPYCGRFASEVQPRLTQDFVNAGKLQIVYYDFPLGNVGEHQYSFLAARAARCAGEQGRYWPMHDYLFGRQSDWSYAATPPVKTFEGYARAIGLDPQKYNACLESDRFADVVSYNHILGERLGVNATPTVIVNEKKVEDPIDYGVLRQVIEQAAGAPAQ